MIRGELFKEKPEFINYVGIQVYEGKNKRPTCIRSKCSIFSNEVFYRLHEDCIVFAVPGLDYVGRTYKPRLNAGAYDFTINSIDLEPGYYPLDEEESNEDQAVFLLKLNEE